LTRFKLLRAAAMLVTLTAAQSQAYGTKSREVAAPLWSAACMTDQGPSQCGEPMWVYVARGGHAGKKNALPREIYAPHSNGGDKTHDDWPANMILG
jgi:hypothetical protein